MLLRLRVRLPFARVSLRSYVKVAPATPPRLVALEVLLPHTPVFCSGQAPDEACRRRRAHSNALPDAFVFLLTSVVALGPSRLG